MFCIKCGSELPEGSRFCSVCGAKLAEHETEDIEIKQERRTPSISFDWSNVQDERHKKVVQDVHSPWGTAALDRKTIEEETTDMVDDRSRTMSFIDMLRQEKEKKQQYKIEEYGFDVKDTEEEENSYTSKEEKLYTPPLYNVEENVSSKYEEVSKHEKFGEKSDSADVTFSTMDFDTTKPSKLEESTIQEERKFEPIEDIIEEPLVNLKEDTIGDLENELASILSNGTEPILSEEDIDVEQKEVNKVVVDEIKDDNKASDVENYGNEQNDEQKEKAENVETLEEKKESFDERNSEDEIAELKKRLAELSANSSNEEEKMQEDTAQEDLEIELVDDNQNTVPEEKKIEENVTESVDNKESDAMTLEELEKGLDSNTTEEEISAEATKKIDKFYTLYKKNEEFQKLLDEEYNMLNSEGEVPHVDEIVSKVNETTDLAKEQKAEEKEAVAEKAETIEKEKEPLSAETPEEKKETETSKLADDAKKEATEKKNEKKKKAKKEKKDDAGSKLTILAVIIVVILVIVLAMILVLYCAPSSIIALKIDQIIETITSYFSHAGIIKGHFLS